MVNNVGNLGDLDPSTQIDLINNVLGAGSDDDDSTAKKAAADAAAAADDDASTKELKEALLRAEIIAAQTGANEVRNEAIKGLKNMARIGGNRV